MECARSQEVPAAQSYLVFWRGKRVSQPASCCSYTRLWPSGMWGGGAAASVRRRGGRADLIVAVKPRDHEHLLEELRALRECIPASGADPERGGRG